MTIALKFVVKCEIFGLDEKFQGACFGHAFSKACHILLLTKTFVGISSLFQSNMLSHVHKNV
jgi:hypothetical protein